MEKKINVCDVVVGDWSSSSSSSSSFICLYVYNKLGSLSQISTFVNNFETVVKTFDKVALNAT